MIAVTGAGGYIGGRIVEHLRAAGLETLALSRTPRATDLMSARYALGAPIDRDVLAGATTVVHAAYDFSVTGRAIHEVNTLGSLPLLQAARESDAHLIYLSSLSAFKGCRSAYGQAKYALEQLALRQSATVLRPGLVFGAPARGLFRSLVKAVEDRRYVPILSSGIDRTFLSFDLTLCELIEQLACATIAQPDRPVLAAHRSPMTLRALVDEIASNRGVHPTTIPLPWRVGYLALRAGELARIPVPFRSDSLIAHVHPVPPNQLVELATSPVTFPPFDADLLRGPS